MKAHPKDVAQSAILTDLLKNLVELCQRIEDGESSWEC